MLTIKGMNKPVKSQLIEIDAEARGFKMSCDIETASILRTLAASCKKGKLLEIGTGAGISLYTVELDENVQDIAKKHLISDKRVQFFTMDGAAYIEEISNQKFDFIFADTWPGKFYLLDETLELLKPGGLYIIDDLLPVPTWSEEHINKVQDLISYLDSREDILLTKLTWSTGLIIATKK